MSKKTIGWFYFKLTTNGNLIGEFSNNNDVEKIYTESADSIDEEKPEISFVGNYISTWQENNIPKFAHLKIDLKHKGRYSLIWTNKKKKKIFIGYGILANNMIVEDYREV